MISLEKVLSKVLGIDPKSITDEMDPGSVPSWDSFNGLLLVTELEKNFGVTFSIDEVIAVKNVGDIRRALKSHGIQL